jgi:hypothetical protein
MTFFPVHKHLRPSLFLVYYDGCPPSSGLRLLTFCPMLMTASPAGDCSSGNNRRMRCIEQKHHSCCCTEEERILAKKGYDSIKVKPKRELGGDLLLGPNLIMNVPASPSILL